jgi:heme exporter protein D
MYFQTMADFWAMGGHGFYVWLAYGFSTLIFIYNIASPILLRRQLRSELNRLQRRSSTSS